MRMRGLLVLSAIVMTAFSAVAQGVNPACQDPTYVGVGEPGGQACQRAVDSYAYAVQQYAVLLSAGNLELGRADGLGKFPNFRVTLRANAMSLVAPAFRASGIPVGPVTTPSTMNTQSTDYAMFAVEGMIGLFDGLDLGFGRVGALDAYASFNLVPGTTAAGYSVTPDHKVYISWGGRVGLLQEGKVLPGVGFSYLQRNMPTSYITASDVFTNTIVVSSLKIDTHAWSVTAGKHFGVLSLVLGGGQTTFTSSALISWAIQTPIATQGSLPTQSAGSTQTQYFGDIGFDLGSSVQIILELGQVSGSSLTTFNTFSPSAGSSRSFGSFAISFGH
jgi:hypothetical protein